MDGLLSAALAGDVRALGRVISRVENGGAEAAALLRALYVRSGRASTVGLTGAPGVGKSTLTDRLTTAYRAQGLRVAIVAVDPTSPFSGGAILGDRIRMEKHYLDPQVFIRSMATRGHLGGIAATTVDVVDVLDAAGYDVVLVETIGVGQDAVDIAQLVGCCLLVLTPGLGDEIQAMKGGIMEVGDIYVVNKADLGGVERVESALHAALSLSDLVDERPILKVSAADGVGVADLIAAIAGTADRLGAATMARRANARARRRVEGVVTDRLARLMKRDVATEGAWVEVTDKVTRRELDPYTAAEHLLTGAGLGGSR